MLGGGVGWEGNQRPSAISESYFLKARNPDSLVQGTQTDTFGAIFLPVKVKLLSRVRLFTTPWTGAC